MSTTQTKTIMADRFKDLNVNNSSQKKSFNKIENSKRENIFKTSDPDRCNHKQRSTTGKSLKQLADESYSRGQSRQNNAYRHRERGNNGKGKMFVKQSKYRLSETIKQEEFNIKDIDFPDLVEDVVKQEETTENIYKDKVNKVQVITSEAREKKLPKGWINLREIKHNKANIDDKDKESEISPYYNPKMAQKILDDRLRYREELNELLGDISPYWDMVYPEDLDYSDDDVYNTDEESEDEEEYVEDW